MMKAIVVKVGLIALFAALGFVYYKVIGCTTGSCPITSNPLIATGYGAMVGFVLGMGVRGKNRARDDVN
jgi:hypothetical protein